MLTIIPCGAKKLSREAPACKLYQGPYFGACIRYALSVTPRDRIFILSALHGLVRPQQFLQPYNLKMGERGCVTSERVAEQARALGIIDTPALVLGGELYTTCARGAFKHAVALTEHMNVPHTGMGYQIGWMKRNAGKIPATALARLDSKGN